MELERIALEDQYFVERKLYPNVVYDCLFVLLGHSCRASSRNGKAAG
jgi:hypothetical protein